MSLSAINVAVPASFAGAWTRTSECSVPIDHISMVSSRSQCSVTMRIRDTP